MDGINISPSRSGEKHVRLSSVDSETTCSSDSQSSDGPSAFSSGAYLDSALSLSPFTSPPTTPRSPLPPSRLHRFTSHDQPSSFASAQKRDWESTTDGLNDGQDKFTQLPIPSSRERRSSSVTLAGHSARRRRSYANLRKSLVCNSSGIDEELSNTPKGLMSPQSSSEEGHRLSRKHIEASRRSAREALEEDLRALNSSTVKNDEFVLDCYFTSLDYLIKALKTDANGVADSKTRKAIQVRLQTLLDSLSTPEEIAADQAHRYQEAARAFQAAPSTHVERCSCVITTVVDYIAFFINILASSLLALIVYIVDLLASSPDDSSRSKAD